MPNKSYDKTVLFFDAARFSTVRGVKKGGKPVRFSCSHSLVDLIEMIKPFVNAAESRKQLASGLLEIYLADIQEDDDFYHLLINCTNATGAHHVSRDISSGAVNSLTYQPEEGPNTSSHVLIRKAEDSNNRNLFLVERAGNLTISRLVSLINETIWQYVKKNENSFLVKHPLGKKNKKNEVKEVKKVPKLELHAYAADHFFSDVEKGFVDSVVLLSDMKKVAGMDVEPPDIFKTWQINVDVSPLKSCSPKDYFKDVFGKGAEFDMEKVRVKFRDETGAGHTKYIDIGAVSLDDYDFYTLTRRISFSFRPRMSYDKVQSSFVQKMITLVHHENL